MEFCQKIHEYHGGDSAVGGLRPQLLLHPLATPPAPAGVEQCERVEEGGRKYQSQDLARTGWLFWNVALNYARELSKLLSNLGAHLTANQRLE